MRRPSLPLAAAAATVVLAALPAGAAGQTADSDSMSVAWSGYVQIFGHAPVDGDGKVELYTLAIGIDAETTGIAGQRFGFHGLARIRDTELREYYDTTVWAQEAYGWWDAPLGRLKAGKVYALGGRFWDGSFFGNVQYFDGLKLDPDFGLSWEGAWAPPAPGGEPASWTLAWGAQWLFDSDGLNGALAGRDPETFDGVDEHDQIRLRLAPAWRPAAGVEAGIGGSWARKELEGAGLDGVEVVDAALDAWVDVGWGEVYAEVLSRDADAAAVPVDPELEGDYLLLGARARRWGLEPYYNHSRVDYAGGAEEWIHQPGIAWSLSPRFTLLYEFDHWTREEPGGERSFVDRSHNVVVVVVF
ncbi:MAG: hypothetical protein R3199_06345 [Gemmatimonadota bacterium]|nr:hypothetical protein [Gemmatimonadota bacterium]